jgi:hypothetical protein
MKKREFFLKQLYEIEQGHLGLINTYKKFQNFLAETGRNEKAIEIGSNILKSKAIRSHIRSIRVGLLEKQQKPLPEKKRKVI